MIENSRVISWNIKLFPETEQETTSFTLYIYIKQETVCKRQFFNYLKSQFHARNGHKQLGKKHPSTRSRLETFGTIKKTQCPELGEKYLISRRETSSH